MKPRVPGHSIKAYRAKRNFDVTSEPPPKVEKKKKTSLMFVIQKHDASHLHYDFRLEMEGVLKSWAVPKGLPYVKGERRLAMHVEDHPMDYAKFEGTIPSGNYGAGTVMVWDIGTYEVLDSDPLAALKAGKMHVMLKGTKLKGEWGMIRMRDESGKDPWLVFKSGEDMKPIAEKVENRSVLTKRTLDEITSKNDKQWVSNRKSSFETETPKPKKSAKAPAKRKARAPDVEFIEPMKCLLLEAPPVGEQWIYELKFDGFRALALKQGDNVKLLSRANKELTSRYPEIVEAIRNLPVESFVIDGEIVALDSEGRSSFQLLQNSQQNSNPTGSICFYVFDALQHEADKLIDLPLSERRKVLENIVPPQSKGILRYSNSITGDPVKLLEEIKRRGMEGIIAKRLDGKYEPGRRSGEWSKIKVNLQQEFVVGGYTGPQGTRPYFGALLVGFYEGEKLRFASKVGTGFDHKTLRELYNQFNKLKLDHCPFVNLPETRSGRYGQGLTKAEMKKCVWVQPSLVAQVSFTEWTNDNHLRHPVFLGLREDKAPKDVTREQPDSESH